MGLVCLVLCKLLNSFVIFLKVFKCVNCSYVFKVESFINGFLICVVLFLVCS